MGKEVLRRKMRRKNAKYRVDQRELVYMYRLELVQRLFGNVGHPEFINLHAACANQFLFIQPGYNNHLPLAHSVLRLWCE